MRARTGRGFLTARMRWSARLGTSLVAITALTTASGPADIPSDGPGLRIHAAASPLHAGALHTGLQRFGADVELPEPALAIVDTPADAPPEPRSDQAVLAVSHVTAGPVPSDNQQACADAGWVVPIDGAYRVTARFGQRGRHWATVHTGIDLAAPMGRPVLATAAGRVTHTGWDGAYGRKVEITHADGTRTWYGHLSTITAAPGVVVAAGDVIGQVGVSGNVTGPHLHFEVRPSGRPVNPQPWLDNAQARPSRSAAAATCVNDVENWVSTHSNSSTRPSQDGDPESDPGWPAPKAPAREPDPGPARHPEPEDDDPAAPNDPEDDDDGTDHDGGTGDSDIADDPADHEAENQHPDGSADEPEEDESNEPEDEHHDDPEDPGDSEGDDSPGDESEDPGDDADPEGPGDGADSDGGTDEPDDPAGPGDEPSDDSDSDSGGGPDDEPGDGSDSGGPDPDADIENTDDEPADDDAELDSEP